MEYVLINVLTNWIILIQKRPFTNSYLSQASSITHQWGVSTFEFRKAEEILGEEWKKCVHEARGLLIYERIDRMVTVQWHHWRLAK